MRELTSHKVNGLNELLTIQVADEPGPGGAHHLYNILLEGTPVAKEIVPSGKMVNSACFIRFQKGAIKEAGYNGISNESLLAIVEDRLNSFQQGPYACTENELALDHVRAAMAQLHGRTKARIARGVEGTNQK